MLVPINLFIIEAIFLILHTNPSFLFLPCSHSPQLHLTPSTVHSSERVRPLMLSQFLSLLTDENSVLLISRVMAKKNIFKNLEESSCFKLKNMENGELHLLIS